MQLFHSLALTGEPAFRRPNGISVLTLVLAKATLNLLRLKKGTDFIIQVTACSANPCVANGGRLRAVCEFIMTVTVGE